MVAFRLWVPRLCLEERVASLMSVRLSACISAVPAKRMFVKFHNGDLGENSLSWAYGAVEMKPRIA